MHKRQEQGFTLIEAAVAIAVVAILSGIVVPLVVKNFQDSQIARAKNDVQVIAAAIASQLKDTGTRPGADSGSGVGNGAGQVAWHSGTAAGTAPTNITLTANNSFTNLFTPVATNAAINTVFGTTASTEFSYKGPYLAPDSAAKTDPWGTSYVILGYSATNLASNGPIWVVCAGPDKAVLNTNTATSTTWGTTGNSADDVVVRVN